MKVGEMMGASFDLHYQFTKTKELYSRFIKERGRLKIQLFSLPHFEPTNMQNAVGGCHAGRQVDAGQAEGGGGNEL